ncbi:MAG: hypothetical protein Q9199_001240 [Rusavskia elegans]
MSMQLCREGIVAGPSSGEGLCGLIQYLEKMRTSGRLSELSDTETGEISCVFICCDLPYQYLDGYFDRLPESQFPPIINQVLLSCDQDKYSESWILSTRQAARMLSCSAQRKQRLRECKRRSYQARGADDNKRTSGTRFLDLRQRDDFETEHVPQSMSSPLKGLTPTIRDLFGDPDTLHMIWTGLQAKFDKDEKVLSPKKQRIVILCYDGDTSQTATSILRAKGYTAFSVSGGFSALRRVTPTSKLSDGDD